MENPRKNYIEEKIRQGKTAGGGGGWRELEETWYEYPNFQFLGTLCIKFNIADIF